jgi:hypothetical protein
MDILDFYRNKLTSPEFERTSSAKGWHRFTDQAVGLVPGCCYMALALCELTGEILKGGGIYEPHARWVHTDLDTGEPRKKAGTGWSFLDNGLGVVLSDKQVFYYKPVPESFQAQQFKYEWLTFAPRS